MIEVNKIKRAGRVAWNRALGIPRVVAARGSSRGKGDASAPGQRGLCECTVGLWPRGVAPRRLMLHKM
ncbi:protein of unknown function [Burkholderia multivorans]